MPSASRRPPIGSVLLPTLHHPSLWLTETPFERQESDADDIQGVLIGGGSPSAFDSGRTASWISRGGPADARWELDGVPVMPATSGPAGDETQSSGDGLRRTVSGAAALSRHVAVHRGG
jgi:hypothetical protein